MRSIARRHWPVITVVGILWALVTICLVLSLRRNQGHLVYTLDDPYIHMAIAKDFAQHGVWGVTRYGFSSSSSSLLWTLLLSSVYLLFGVNEVAPLALNVVFGTLIYLLVYVLLRRHQLQPVFTFLGLLFMTFCTPLTSLTFSGHEHILHTLFTILFVYLSAKILATDEPTRLESSSLLIIAPLLIMTRYEGLFLLLVACCLFLAKRKPLYALLLGGLGMLPIAIYGLLSVSRGWYLLPNPVLLKGVTPALYFSTSLESIVYFVFHGFQHIITNPHILVLVLGGLILFHRQYGKHRAIWKDSMIMIVFLVVVICLHMQFAGITGIRWFYRYEAYLLGLGVFVMGISWREYLPRRVQVQVDKESIPQYVALAFLIVLLVSPFALTGVRSLAKVPQATTNIYEQQYQMGLFLREFYQGEAVAANDIGAISYLADIRCFDLFGLANLEVARAKERGGHYDSQQLDELTRSDQVSIAIVHEVFETAFGVPPQWIKVGQWKIENNVVCWDDTISFFAVDPSEADDLIDSLRVFSSRLPADVVQSGTYVE